MSNERLYDGADLDVTTDYRQVLAEIVLLRLNNPYLGIVFPGFTDYAPLGIVSGTAIPPIIHTHSVHLPLIRQ